MIIADYTMCEHNYVGKKSSPTTCAKWQHVHPGYFSFIFIKWVEVVKHLPSLFVQMVCTYKQLLCLLSSCEIVPQNIQSKIMSQWQDEYKHPW